MNALYDFGREGFLAADIDWDGDDIRLYLVDDTDYTVDLAADQFVSDVPVAAREEKSAAFSGKTVTDGTADADDVTFTAAAGDPCEELVLANETGLDSTSRLIANIDTATGLPVILNGGDVTVQWDPGADRIFTL